MKSVDGQFQDDFTHFISFHPIEESSKEGSGPGKHELYKSAFIFVFTVQIVYI